MPVNDVGTQESSDKICYLFGNLSLARRIDKPTKKQSQPVLRPLGILLGSRVIIVRMTESLLLVALSLVLSLSLTEFGLTDLS